MHNTNVIAGILFFDLLDMKPTNFYISRKILVGEVIVGRLPATLAENFPKKQSVKKKEAQSKETERTKTVLS